MSRKNSGMSVRCGASSYRPRGRSRATYNPSTRIRSGRNCRRTGARTQIFASGHGRARTRNRWRRQRTRRSRGPLPTGVDETVGTRHGLGQVSTGARFARRAGTFNTGGQRSLHCRTEERRISVIGHRDGWFSHKPNSKRCVRSCLIGTCVPIKSFSAQSDK